MPTRVMERARVPLPAEEAEILWTDVSRWPSFVEGFRHAVELSETWPEPGSKVAWESGPGGRGRVTEKALVHEPGIRLVVNVFEERMAGEQEVTFAPTSDGGCVVTVELRYDLTKRGPVRAVANAIFIRRAISDSIARTLRRFAVEAEEQAHAEA